MYMASKGAYLHERFYIVINFLLFFFKEESIVVCSSDIPLLHKASPLLSY